MADKRNTFPTTLAIVVQLCLTLQPHELQDRLPCPLLALSLLRFISIDSVMPTNHLILCHPLLLLPSIFPSIRVFSNESALHIRWPKCCNFSISPSNEYSGLISFRTTGLISLLAKGLSRVFSTTVRKHQFFSTQLFILSSSHIHP